MSLLRCAQILQMFENDKLFLSKWITDGKLTGGVKILCAFTEHHFWNSGISRDMFYFSSGE